MKRVYDLVCIGAGPAGFACAVKAAAVGMKVAVVDKAAAPGGTCTAVGCIPSKSLLHSTHLFTQTRDLVRSKGTIISPSWSKVKFDFARMRKIQDETVARHHAALMKAVKDAKIDGFFNRAAKLKSSNEVVLPNGDVLHTRATVLATGSSAAQVPFLKIDEKRVLSSTGAVFLNTVPKSLTVLGAGVIGLELGSVFARLGTRVTFVEMLPTVGSVFIDAEVATRFQGHMEKQGMRFLLRTRALSAATSRKGVVLTVQDEKGTRFDVMSEKLLVSVGRTPNTSGIGLEALKVEMNRDRTIRVDSRLMTSVRDLYAIGDIVPGPMIAHKATMEASAVVDVLRGQAPQLDYGSLPCVVYTSPELAFAGKSSATLAKEGVNFKAYRFDFNSEMRDPTCESLDGFMKVLVDAKDERILGVHVIGATGGDIVSEGTLAILVGAKMKDFGNSAHAHPFFKSFRTMLRAGKAY